MAISLDGFIADENGGVDWLNQLSTENEDNEDFGYSDLFEKTDCLVMGRNSYETVLGFGNWPYLDKPVVVLTNRPPPAEIPEGATVDFKSGSPQQLIDVFRAEDIQHIYLDGGHVIQQFLSAGFIDEIILTQVPALLGKGIPLFLEPLESDDWKLDSSKLFSNGFVQRHFLRTR